MDLRNHDASDRKRWESVTDEMARVLREKSGAQRLAMTHRMWRFAYQIATRSVRGQHPDWTDSEVRKEVARRMSHGAVGSSQRLEEFARL